MIEEPFRALVASQAPEGQYQLQIKKKDLDELPQGEVLVRVHYSSLNYKDALSATGNRGVTRRYPHTPGIDAAGVVEQSVVQEFEPGDEVVVTGHDLGSNTDGGFADYIRVPAAWIVRRPASISLRESMILGTAGYTAGLSVYRLIDHNIVPANGPVLVTGATGGVGCISVAILSRLGYHVIAATGKADARQFLSDLGAKEIVDRDEIKDTTNKGLLAGRWAGVVDTVGGQILDSAIRHTMTEGAVASCGNVTSGELHTSVFPFILRGIALIGINSAFTPMNIRQTIWRELATDWKLDCLERLTTEVALDKLDKYIELILKGKIRGRILVKIT